MKAVSRGLWIICGFVCVGLGVLGLVVPMMPGVVFLLIAAYCFSRSSERYHRWLLNHSRLGPPIVHWQQSGAITKNNKWLITVMLIASILAGWGFGFVTPILLVQIIAIAAVLAFIWTRPSV